VPGLAFTGAVVHHPVALLGLRYADLPPTGYGVALMVGLLALAAVVVGRYVRAWRLGDRAAGVVAVAIVATCLMGANDALVTSGVMPGVYLVDLGFLVPIAAVGHALAARFASEARDLGELRDRLEALVRERTVALERTTRGLVDSERMAAMARLAAGVAHEINNPAAALGANLRYLSEGLRAGEPVPEDAMETLADAGALIERISGYVRHLVDASRLAGAAPRFGAVASLARAVGDAVFLGPHGIRVEVPADLRVAIDPEVLAQALGMVLRAVSRDFARPLRIAARQEGGTARLLVTLADPALPPVAGQGARADLIVAAGLLGIYGAVLTPGAADAAMVLPLAQGGLEPSPRRPS
jgi:C4-dicarboxylate-specific signal transduction histidine kinase